jgi:hypothetical protein
MEMAPELRHIPPLSPVCHHKFSWKFVCAFCGANFLLAQKGFQVEWPTENMKEEEEEMPSSSSSPYPANFNMLCLGTDFAVQSARGCIFFLRLKSFQLFGTTQKWCGGGMPKLKFGPSANGGG